MKKHVLGGLAAVLVFGVSASAAHAQCAFPHPKVATKTQATLVQAFVSCGNVGGNSPTTKTEGNVDACKPVETYFEQSNNQTTGWRFGVKGKGQVQVKAVKVAPPGVTPADSTDVLVSAKVSDVEDQAGPPGVGTDALHAVGTVSTTARATFNDRTNGDLTVTDFPADFAIPLMKGAGKIKLSADLGPLATLSQPGLPHCTSIENVSIFIKDTGGDIFANQGIFLP